MMCSSIDDSSAVPVTDGWMQLATVVDRIMMRAQIQCAVSLAKQGALRSKIVRETGLTAEQVNEIKERVKP